MATTKERKRKVVESTFADKWEPVNDGDELSGIYLGSERVKGKKGEDFTVYHVKTDAGKKWSVAGAHLDSIMPQIKRGTFVWVTKTGKTKTTSGEMVLFKVECEEDTELNDPYEGKEPQG